MTYQLTFEALHDYSSSDAILLLVRLSYDGAHVEANAFVDTGSTFCVFKRQIAAALGINVETGTPISISTATGTFTAYGHALTLETLGKAFETTIYFAAMEGFSRNVLGRLGWLNQVRVGIVEHESKLYVSRYDDE